VKDDLNLPEGGDGRRRTSVEEIHSFSSRRVKVWEKRRKGKKEVIVKEKVANQGRRPCAKFQVKRENP